MSVLFETTIAQSYQATIQYRLTWEEQEMTENTWDFLKYCSLLSVKCWHKQQVYLVSMLFTSTGFCVPTFSL